MLELVARFTMHRHRNLRTGPAIHLRQLVAAGMARDVDKVILRRQKFHAECRKLVVQLENRQLVSRNDPRREDHCIAFSKADVGMVIVGDAGQRCARLTLASGAQI